jgi:hypothetical protein
MKKLWVMSVVATEEMTVLHFGSIATVLEKY